MHDEQARLRAAICQDHQDDGARLVYADWLEEHGDGAGRARADFIRLQLQLARMDEGDERCDALRQQEAHLLRDHLDAWEREDVGNFPSLRLRDHWGVAHYRRGFPARVYVHDLLSYLDHYEAVAHFVPAPERLLYWPAEPDPNHLDALLAFPRLAGITGVKITPPGECLRGMEHFLRGAPDADLITRVDARDSNLRGLDLIEVMTAAPRACWSLHFLDLTGTGVGDETVQALAYGPFYNVRSLALGARDVTGDDELTAWGLRALSDSLTRALEHLDLHNNRGIGPAGVRVIADSRWAANLRSLDLTGCDIQDEGVAALANSPHLRQLRRLRLAFNGITDRGAEALARSPNLTRLARLKLGVKYGQEASISQRGARLLRERFGHRVKGL